MLSSCFIWQQLSLSFAFEGYCAQSFVDNLSLSVCLIRHVTASWFLNKFLIFKGFLCVIRNCFLIVLLMFALLAFRHFVHAVFTFNVDLSFFFKTLAFLSSFVFIIKLRGRYRDFPIPLYPHIYI